MDGVHLGLTLGVLDGVEDRQHREVDAAPERLVGGLQVLRPGSGEPTADPGDEADEILDGEPDAPDGTNWRAVLIVVGGVLLFILILEPIGWLISATLLFGVVAAGMGARNHAVSLVAGLGLAAVIQLMFSALLGIHIPPGILG